MKSAFLKWDVDGSGFLEFDELFEIMVPGNFSGEGHLMHKLSKGELQKGGEATFQQIQMAMKGILPQKRLDQKQWAAKLDKKSTEKEHTKLMETHELCQIVRDKVNSHSRGGHTQMRDSYNFFGRPSHGITKQAFKEKLNLWCLFLTNAQLDAVFAQIDADGNGVVSFAEFLRFFGADNNFHPLYMEKGATGGVLDRKLSFLPDCTHNHTGASTGPDAEEQNAMSRTRRNMKLNASGTPMRHVVRAAISQASRKGQGLRLVDPTFRQDRNGMLANGDYRIEEVSQFISRLLQNARTTVLERGVGENALDYLSSRLLAQGANKFSATQLKKEIGKNFAKPLPILRAHFLGPVLQHYTIPARATLDDMGFDVRALLRDARPVYDAMTTAKSESIRSMQPGTRTLGQVQLKPNHIDSEVAFLTGRSAHEQALHRSLNRATLTLESPRSSEPSPGYLRRSLSKSQMRAALQKKLGSSRSSPSGSWTLPLAASPRTRDPIETQLSQQMLPAGGSSLRGVPSPIPSWPAGLKPAPEPSRRLDLSRLPAAGITSRS
jgi:Ca2+-binding EF-hand superfamily protein